MLLPSWLEGLGYSKDLLWSVHFPSLEHSLQLGVHVTVVNYLMCLCPSLFIIFGQRLFHVGCEVASEMVPGMMWGSDYV